MPLRIIVADDEDLTRRSLQELLRSGGHTVVPAENGEAALHMLRSRPADIVFADMKMPGLDGIELLRILKTEFPSVEVVMMTGYGRIEHAVEAMRLGATDFITKPIDEQALQTVIERIARKKQSGAASDEFLTSAERAGAGMPPPTVYRFYNVVGGNEKMRRIYAMIESIADSPSTVLIYGESGTGKRMVAQAIHQADTSRRSKPFIEVSCGALPETLLESELFGHVKGSFTGAIKDRAGRFELAAGGTIFLDEIDTCSPALQVKLLRVLQDGEFERVGDTRTLKAYSRVIAATNQNLEELCRRKSFREDLFWRLNVITLHLPPLRDRPDDIAMLGRYFLDKYNAVRQQMKKSAIIERISDEAMQAMVGYPWPGNVRELENTIERACILVKNNMIRLKDLPDSIVTHKEPVRQPYERSAFSLRDALRLPERDIVLHALEHTNWNCSKTAAYLGINRTTLYNKMKIYGIKRSQGKDELVSNTEDEVS